MKIKILGVVLISLAFFNAGAAEIKANKPKLTQEEIDRNNTNSLRELSLIIPQKLSKKYKGFGFIDIQDLIEGINRVTWEVVKNLPPMDETSKKVTGRHIVGSNHVQISLESLNLMISAEKSALYIQAFFLHESLGALGYDDLEGELSLGMALLASDDFPENLKLDILDWFNRKRMISAFSGTSVVGGGDFRYFYFKMDSIFGYFKIKKERANVKDIAKILEARVGLHKLTDLTNVDINGENYVYIVSDEFFYVDDAENRFYFTIAYFIEVYRFGALGKKLRSSFLEFLRID